jgi:hypothetical protein
MSTAPSEARPSLERSINGTWIDYGKRTGLSERQLPAVLRERGDDVGHVHTATYAFGAPNLTARWVIGTQTQLAACIGLSARSFRRWSKSGSLDWICSCGNLYASDPSSLDAAKSAIRSARSESVSRQSETKVRASDRRFRSGNHFTVGA